LYGSQHDAAFVPAPAPLYAPTLQQSASQPNGMDYNNFQTMASQPQLNVPGAFDGGSSGGIVRALSNMLCTHSLFAPPDTFNGGTGDTFSGANNAIVMQQQQQPPSNRFTPTISMPSTMRGGSQAPTMRGVPPPALSAPPLFPANASSREQTNQQYQRTRSV
jgi:hypothetical protein